MSLPGGGASETSRVTTRWEVRELSLVPIGADAAAKIREDTGLKPPRETENRVMPKDKAKGASEVKAPDESRTTAVAAERKEPTAPAGELLPMVELKSDGGEARGVQMERDRQASQVVMRHIAQQLPAHLRGEFAES